MRSMTGFGRAQAEQDGRKITIEIRAVNHRFLDINTRIPRSLGFAEENIGKTIKGKLSRGRVDVFVNFFALADSGKKANPDIGLIRAYVIAARKAAKDVGLLDDLQLSHIIRIPDTILIEEVPEDEDMLLQLLEGVLSKALDALIDMREREGKELEASISEYLNALEKTAGIIDSNKDHVAKECSEKLKLRIEELLGDCTIDETRFNTEVAYIADKADISEEIVRLCAHIKQFRSNVSSDTAVGRKLDFMVQEMNRELNTIGSKSQDLLITNAVIEGKSIVEKIREQVQNIE